MAEIGECRKVVAYVVVGRQLALGGEQEDGGTGELLADRRDAEGGGVTDRNGVFDAGQACAFVDGEMVAEDDTDGDAGATGRAPRRKQALRAAAK